MNAMLRGRTILVVEDQPLIALDIVESLRKSGASVLTALTLQEGLRVAEHPQLSAAILDFALGHENCLPLCVRLRDRQIPFVVHSGYADVPALCGHGVIVPKPATSETLVNALAHIFDIPRRAERAN